MVTSIPYIGKPRLDTRGLPEGYDPHKLYEYRYETFKPSNGLESFVYKLMPVSVFKSIAFAIDPTARFKTSAGKVTPVNRKRVRATASVLDLRYRTGPVYQRSYSQVSNYMGHSLCSSPFMVDTVYNSPEFRVDLTRQPVLEDHVQDTTNRTRLLGSEIGELELFKHDLFSTPRSAIFTRTERRYTDGVPFDPACSAVGGVPDYEVGTDIRIYRNYFGHSAILPESTYDTLKASEIDFNLALAKSYSVKMLAGWSPSRREYSLLRNAIELRDLPRSVLQLQQTMENVRKVFDSFGRSSKTRDLIFDLKRSSKDIPSEWLSFHFGWKQTYKDLVDLLELPEKLSKRVNFLMKRHGRESTFRVQREHLSAASGVSGFQYDIDTGFEFNSKVESRLERKSKLNLTVNATINFPYINIPSLARTYTWYDKAGILPRFIDVYNLTPWTWLFDWFTGCADYLSLIEEIQHDQNLVNWGMLSVHTEGKLITDMYCEVPQESQIVRNNGPAENSSVMRQFRHQSRCEYECRTRYDVGALYDKVNLTSVPSSLTAYQNSILGAILLQFSSNSREKAFRPRS